MLAAVGLLMTSARKRPPSWVRVRKITFIYRCLNIDSPTPRRSGHQTPIDVVLQLESSGCSLLSPLQFVRR